MAIRTLQFDLLERLLYEGKYLGAYICNSIPLKAYHRLPQSQSKEANNNFSPYWYSSINSQANNEAYNYQA